MMRNADHWISNLNLIPHPEGGYFKEVYRSSEEIQSTCLPDRFDGNRNFSTAIYFLLKKNDKSVFHRIKSDETWHFYDGDNLSIYLINQDGELVIHELGLKPELNILPQITIPANCWFAAETNASFTLVGCTVAPGFNFNDFEMGNRVSLVDEFPKHERTIIKFTNEY
jgi:uncharacterized protein